MCMGGVLVPPSLPQLNGSKGRDLECYAALPTSYFQIAGPNQANPCPNDVFDSTFTCSKTEFMAIDVCLFEGGARVTFTAAVRAVNPGRCKYTKTKRQVIRIVREQLF